MLLFMERGVKNSIVYAEESQGIGSGRIVWLCFIDL
jgi:hypothetical protein